MVHKIISVKKTQASDIFGSTWDVANLLTGKEFTIDQYPKRERGGYGKAGYERANFIVEEKFNPERFWKFRTLHEAKSFIEGQR